MFLVLSANKFLYNELQTVGDSFHSLIAFTGKRRIAERSQVRNTNEVTIILLVESLTENGENGGEEREDGGGSHSTAAITITAAQLQLMHCLHEIRLIDIPIAERRLRRPYPSRRRIQKCLQDCHSLTHFRMSSACIRCCCPCTASLSKSHPSSWLSPVVLHHPRTRCLHDSAPTTKALVTQQSRQASLHTFTVNMLLSFELSGPHISIAIAAAYLGKSSVAFGTAPTSPSARISAQMVTSCCVWSKCNEAFVWCMTYTREHVILELFPNIAVRLILAGVHRAVTAHPLDLVLHHLDHVIEKRTYK